MAPKHRQSRGSKSPQPYPSSQPERGWQEAQAERLDAARLVLSGLAGVRPAEVLPHLYEDSARACVDWAVQQQRAASRGKGAGKGATKGKASRHSSPSPPPGQAASSSQPAPSTFPPAYRNNEEANLLQNRLGEDMPSRFHPARHTVMIVGRPVQATTTAMPLSHEPPAIRQDSIQVPLVLNSSLGAR